MENRICFSGKAISEDMNLMFDETNKDMLSAMAAKDEFANELIKMAEEGLDFAVTLSDNIGKGPLYKYRQAYKEHLIDAGIAEANQIGMSAGIALAGKMVFAQVFGPFLSLRALDQVHTDIAYNDLPVRLMGTHGGLTSNGGPTHYTIMDIAIMRSLPNMTVIVPGDPRQCTKAVRASINHEGPVFIRMARGVEPSVYITQDYPYEIGKAITTLEGEQITVIACGVGVAMAVCAANNAADNGISVRVIDMHTIKPIDKDIIIKAAKETGRILTVEDHLINGGLGTSVAEVLAEARIGIPFKRLGIPDVFPPNGKAHDLYHHFGYDEHGILEEIRNMVQS